MVVATLGELRRALRAVLSEVDLDPSNNPGRPADAAEYIGMRPAPTAAMAHPSLGGGAGGGAPSDSGADPVVDVNERAVRW